MKWPLLCKIILLSLEHVNGLHTRKNMAFFLKAVDHFSSAKKAAFENTVNAIYAMNCSCTPTLRKNLEGEAYFSFNIGFQFEELKVQLINSNH